MLTERTGPLALSAACLLLCAACAAFAQAGEPSARLIDEFGDVLPTDMAARLDNFAIELQNAPHARAFLIVYRSRRDLPGLSGRRANWMRSYLVHSRGIDAGRVVVVDGGATLCISHELWVVPPKRRDDVYRWGYADTDVARKYDEYHFTIPEDMLVSFSSEYEDGLEGFAGALREEPRASAYIIAYEGYRVDTWYSEEEGGRKKTHRRVSIDPRGTALTELRSKRAALVNTYGISPRRVKLINGGYRKWREVEFWLVPAGARPPAPTPNVYPPRRRSSRREL